MEQFFPPNLNQILPFQRYENWLLSSSGNLRYEVWRAKEVIFAIWMVDGEEWIENGG